MSDVVSTIGKGEEKLEVLRAVDLEKLRQHFESIAQFLDGIKSGSITETRIAEILGGNQSLAVRYLNIAHDTVKAIKNGGESAEFLYELFDERDKKNDLIEATTLATALTAFLSTKDTRTEVGLIAVINEFTLERLEIDFKSIPAGWAKPMFLEASLKFESSVRYNNYVVGINYSKGIPEVKLYDQNPTTKQFYLVAGLE